jgi:hypothetical protein
VKHTGGKNKKDTDQVTLDFERQSKDEEATELKTVGQIMETFVFRFNLLRQLFCVTPCTKLTAC